MNFNYVRIAAFAVWATIGLNAFSQDMIAKQAPIDKKLKSVDSLALQQLLKIERTVLFSSDIYPEWSNQYVHTFNKEVNIPESYAIDLTGFCMPTSNTRITSPFGPRRRRMHSGLDVKVMVGDTIVSAFDGKVRVVRTEKRGYGKYVVIRHHNGLETVYGHLSLQLVQENQVIKAGEPIGLGGNTGRSSGSHLHFETRLVGIPLNPALLFDFPNQDVTADSYVYHSYKGSSKEAGGHSADNKAIRYHKVKAGDTLSKIASKQGVSIDTLCKLNRITKKTTLRPGQILRCS